MSFVSESLILEAFVQTLHYRPLDYSISHRFLRIEEFYVRRVVKALDAYYRHKVASGTLSIAIVTDPVISEIHKRFMDDPSATDVITFTGIPGEDAGEIIISADHAWKASKTRNNRIDWEMTLYLVHGWLHLAGLDDRSYRTRRLMRAAEKELMSWLTRRNTYLQTCMK